jgi:hypothetical protein
VKDSLRTARLSFVVAMLVPAMLVSPGIAHGVVRPADEAAAVITATQHDGAGGVHVERSERGELSRAALRSVDVSRVDYRVDRAEQTLTVSIKVRHRPVALRRPFRQYFATVVSTDLPFVVLVSRPGKSRVSTVEGDNSLRTCAGGATRTSKRGRVLTQTVPFSCLKGVEHARLWTGAGIERRNGGDVAYDTAHRTRDLPLTAYDAPPPA